MNWHLLGRTRLQGTPVDSGTHPHLCTAPASWPAGCHPHPPLPYRPLPNCCCAAGWQPRRPSFASVDGACGPAKHGDDHHAHSRLHRLSVVSRLGSQAMFHLDTGEGCSWCLKSV